MPLILQTCLTRHIFHETLKPTELGLKYQRNDRKWHHFKFHWALLKTHSLQHVRCLKLKVKLAPWPVGDFHKLWHFIPRYSSNPYLKNIYYDNINLLWCSKTTWISNSWLQSKCAIWHKRALKRCISDVGWLDVPLLSSFGPVWHLLSRTILIMNIISTSKEEFAVVSKANGKRWRWKEMIYSERNKKIRTDKKCWRKKSLVPIHVL